jgi:L-threonylcarbamoyladenylate synthase
LTLKTQPLKLPPTNLQPPTPLKPPTPPLHLHPHPQLYSREFTDAALEAAPTTPGMKYRHYSPSAPVVLIEPPRLMSHQDAEDPEEKGGGGGAAAAVAAAAAAAARELAAGGAQRVALLRTTLPAGAPLGWQARGGGEASRGGGESGGSGSGESSRGGAVLEYCLGPMAAPSEVARRLFAALRDAEDAGAAAIVVEGVPDAGEGAAVMNRLRKAASSTRRAG